MKNQSTEHGKTENSKIRSSTKCEIAQTQLRHKRQSTDCSLQISNQQTWNICMFIGRETKHVYYIKKCTRYH